MRGSGADIDRIKEALGALPERVYFKAGGNSEVSSGRLEASLRSNGDVVLSPRDDDDVSKVEIPDGATDISLSYSSGVCFSYDSRNYRFGLKNC